jgi:hypothetical protein
MAITSAIRLDAGAAAINGSAYRAVSNAVFQSIIKEGVDMCDEFKAIAARLYVVARQCTCEYARNNIGVPLWSPGLDGSIERKLIKKCSRCEVREDYELLAGIKV